MSDQVLSFGEAADVVRIVLHQLAMNTFPDSLGEARGPIKTALTTGAPEEGRWKGKNQRRAPEEEGNNGPGRMQRRAEQHQAAEHAQG